MVVAYPKPVRSDPDSDFLRDELSKNETKEVDTEIKEEGKMIRGTEAAKKVADADHKVQYIGCGGEMNMRTRRTRTKWAVLY